MGFIPREVQLNKGDIYENIMPVHVQLGYFEPHNDFRIMGWDSHGVEMDSVESLINIHDQFGRLYNINTLIVSWEEFSNFRLVRKLNP